MTPQIPSRRGPSGRLILLLRILLAAVVIWFVATRIDTGAIIETARSARPLLVAIALALLPLNIALEAATWLPLLRRVVPGTGLRQAVVGVLSGYPLGIITPARVGDFAGRAFSMPDGDRVRIAVSAAAARLPDLIAILLAGTAALVASVAAGILEFAGWAAMGGIAAVLLVLLTLVVLDPAIIRRVAAALPLASRWEPKLDFLTTIPAPVMLRVVLLAVARLGVYSSQFLLLALSFAPGLSVGRAFAAILLTLMAKSIIPPVTVLDLGIREGAAAFFFGRLGLGAAVGFNAALLLFAINLALPAAVASPLVSRYRLRTRSPLPEVAAAEPSS